MTNAIEWTDRTWNPIVGCSRVSPGCEHCYAERFVHRELAPQHRGLTVLGKQGPRWTGEVRLVRERLALPVRWREPKRIFVNSLSDLFHEALSDDDIDEVFGAMWACLYTSSERDGHTFQILTKRPARMRDYFSGEKLHERWARSAVNVGGGSDPDGIFDQTWIEAKKGPHPRIWLGVTVEDQQRADERIPLLLDTPAAKRFVSYEPALGPVRLDHLDADRAAPSSPWCQINALTGRHTDMGRPCPEVAKLDWVIVGGESGPGARPFDLAWARSVVGQCREAGVPVFVKQLGAAPVDAQWSSANPPRLVLLHRKGADPSEWPADLQARDFPA